MKTKTSKTKQVEHLTYSPVLPLQTAHEEFAASVPEPSQGANNYLPAFLRVAEGIMANGRSFTYEDVRYHTRILEIPAPETKQLFDRWTQTLVQLGKLEQVAGAYEDF